VWYNSALFAKPLVGPRSLRDGCENRWSSANIAREFSRQGFDLRAGRMYGGGERRDARAPSKSLGMDQMPLVLMAKRCNLIFDL
jgi:hypothetical protein